MLPDVRTLPIYDMRPIGDAMSLDREGFKLITAPTEAGQVPLTGRGALIKLAPIGSASPGVQTIVAPRGYAITHPEDNYLIDPVSVV